MHQTKGSDRPKPELKLTNRGKNVKGNSIAAAQQKSKPHIRLKKKVKSGLILIFLVYFYFYFWIKFGSNIKVFLLLYTTLLDPQMEYLALKLYASIFIDLLWIYYQLVSGGTQFWLPFILLLRVSFSEGCGCRFISIDFLVDFEVLFFVTFINYICYSCR